jgi:hypothetical protein
LLRSGEHSNVRLRGWRLRLCRRLSRRGRESGWRLDLPADRHGAREAFLKLLEFLALKVCLHLRGSVVNLGK